MVIRNLIILAAALMMNACGTTANSFNSKKSTVRGTTSIPAVLFFSCDDGKFYETRSHTYGDSVYRFSLSLPYDSVCRLQIDAKGQRSVPVTFMDYRGNSSSLIYLKSAHIDLGRLFYYSKQPSMRIVNDDIMLVSTDNSSSSFSETVVFLYVKDEIKHGKTKWNSGS